MTTFGWRAFSLITPKASSGWSSASPDLPVEFKVSPESSLLDRSSNLLYGIRTDENALIKAMNVTGDYLVEEYSGCKARQRAGLELDLIKQLEGASGRALAMFRVLVGLDYDGERGLISLVEQGTLTQVVSAGESM